MAPLFILASLALVPAAQDRPSEETAAARAGLAATGEVEQAAGAAADASGEELLRGPTLGDRVIVSAQVATFAAVGWALTTPFAAITMLAIQGVVPSPFSFLILFFLVPPLMGVPPLAAAGLAALSGLGGISPWGVLFVALAALAASAGAALVVAPVAVVRLLAPPVPSLDGFGVAMVTWLMAGGALVVVPALSAALAVAVVAPWFVEGSPPGVE